MQLHSSYTRVHRRLKSANEKPFVPRDADLLRVQVGVTADDAPSAEVHLRSRISAQAKAHRAPSVSCYGHAVHSDYHTHLYVGPSFFCMPRHSLAHQSACEGRASALNNALCALSSASQPALLGLEPLPDGFQWPLGLGTGLQKERERERETGTGRVTQRERERVRETQKARNRERDRERARERERVRVTERWSQRVSSRLY